MHHRLLLVLLPALLTGCPRKSSGDDDDDGGGDGGGWDLGDAGDSGVTDGTDAPDTDTSDTDTDTSDTDTADTDADTDTDGTDTTDTDATDTTDTDTDTDTDTSVDLDPRIDSVDPAYGSTAGGTRVTISGSDLSTVTGVTFGGRAGTIISARATEVEVFTPGVTTQDPVDVEIESPDGTDVLVDGYGYFLPGSGLTAAIGTVGEVEYVGDYWSSTAGLATAAATIALIEPIDDFDIWTPYASSLDTCVNPATYSGGGDFTAVDYLMDDMILRAGSDTLSLPWIDADFHYEDLDLTASRLTPGDSFDLVAPDSRWLPAESVSDFVELPSGFSIVTPDIGGSEPPSGGSGDLDFTWTGAGRGDYVLIEMQLYDNSLTTLYATRSCVARDDGSFSVPSDLFGTNWRTLRILLIYAFQMKDSDAVLPWNDGEVDVLGYTGEIGAFIAVEE